MLALWVLTPELTSKDLSTYDRFDLLTRDFSCNHSLFCSRRLVAKTWVSGTTSAVNKISCRKETVRLLRGLVWAKYNWKTIFWGHHRSIFNYCDVIGLLSYRIWWNNAKRVSLAQNFRQNGLPPNHSSVQKIKIYMWYKNVGTSFFRFVTMHAFDRQTDEQTDRKAFTIPCVTLHAGAR